MKTKLSEQCIQKLQKLPFADMVQAFISSRLGSVKPVHRVRGPRHQISVPLLCWPRCKVKVCWQHDLSHKHTMPCHVWARINIETDFGREIQRLMIDVTWLQRAAKAALLLLNFMHLCT